MYEVNNNVTKIEGKQGFYSDKNVTNPSEKYGRNAVDNFYTYIEKPITEENFNTAPILDFGINPENTKKNIEKLEKFTKENDAYLKALPPLEFEYRYMPNLINGKIDKNALYGAAFEDMKQRKEMTVEEMDNYFAPSDEFTSKALDINNDGKITNAEYSTSILAADMLSKQEPKPENIDGTINKNGMNAILEYSKKSNAAAASKMYTSLYNKYNLDK